MFKRDALLDLGILCLHPRVVLVAICVELCQGAQTLFGPVVVDEPTGRLDMH